MVDLVPVARSLNVLSDVKDKNISVVAQVNVSCPVVFPVLSAISVKRQSQKKDVRPLSEAKKRIKSVKSVSIVDHYFCPKCVTCPQCCICSASGRSSAKLLADMLSPGHESKGGVYPEGWVHSNFQTQTSSGERAVDS